MHAMQQLQSSCVWCNKPAEWCDTGFQCLTLHTSSQLWWRLELSSAPHLEGHRTLASAQQGTMNDDCTKHSISTKSANVNEHPGDLWMLEIQRIGQNDSRCRHFIHHKAYLCKRGASFAGHVSPLLGLTFAIACHTVEWATTDPLKEDAPWLLLETAHTSLVKYIITVSDIVAGLMERALIGMNSRCKKERIQAASTLKKLKRHLRLV